MRKTLYSQLVRFAVITHLLDNASRLDFAMYVQDNTFVHIPSECVCFGFGPKAYKHGISISQEFILPQLQEESHFLN